MKTIRLVACSLVVGGLWSCGVTAFAQTGPVDASKIQSPALNIARQLNQAFIEVAERVSPAVVVIKVTQKLEASSRSESSDEDSWWDLLPPEMRRYLEERRNHPAPRRRAPTGQGSGIVMSEDGYIVTNNHVVEDAEKITVVFRDGKELSAEVKGRDPNSDIAVIKIKEGRGLAYAQFGDSAAARVGEFVIAIGAPFDLDYSVTVGHVSAKGRALPEIAMAVGPYADQDFIQTDASINPGNSGGPLVNLYGEVIGINTAIRGIGTGIGFAVPSQIAKNVADHLIKEGKFVRSRIGIAIKDLREDQESKPSFPDLADGVVVREIQADGPAAKSELKAGDVVTAVNGRTVKTSRELKEQVAYTPPGEMVALDVARPQAQGKPRLLKIKVKTEAIPDENGASGGKRTAGASDAAESFGLTVKALTEELAEEYGVEEKQGVMVTAVISDSMAEEKGIKAGDVITEVNRQPVANLRQFREAMKAADKKKGVILNLVSKGSSYIAVLKDE